MKFKIHRYIIEHTKTSLGDSRFSIMHLWFGFIKWPFYEKEVVHAPHNHYKWKPYTRWFSYPTLEDAKKVLQGYLDIPYVEYRGYTLTRCANNTWLVYSTGKPASERLHWMEYEIGGTLENCKALIDKDIEHKKNDKFREIIKI